MARYRLTVLFLLLFINNLESFAQSNTRKRELNQIINRNKASLSESNSPEEKMKACHKIANAYIGLHDTRKAIPYLRRSIDYADEINKYSFQYDLRKYLSRKYIGMKNYNDAISTLAKAVEISLKNNEYDDASTVIGIMEEYQENIGESQDSLIQKSKKLLKLAEDKNSLADKRTSLIYELNKKIKESKESKIHGYISNKKHNETINVMDSLAILLNSVNYAHKLTKDSLVRERTMYHENLQISENENIKKETNIKSRERIIYIILFTFSIIFFVVFRSNIIQKRQKRKLYESKLEIEEKSFELESQNEELNSTLDRLRKTQKQLIIKGQMASLGQLMAGIAHEINNPMGAIESSIDTVIQVSKANRKLLPELLNKITDEQYLLVLDMLDEGIKNLHHYTVSEERAIKKKLKAQLIKKGINNSQKIAGYLIDIGVHEISSKYMQLLENKHVDLIMKTTYNAAIQIKNGLIISNSVERASKIIKALKNYSHKGHDNKMIKSNLIQGIESTLTIYHNQLKHRIEIKKNFEKLPEIFCFPDELSQVWVNLISNSLHAIKGKGRISITAKSIGDDIIITFNDNGSGIPENIKDRIFEPFFTTKLAGDGTGLGLDIIKKIIEKHDGKISFESKEGVGTSFMVKLPINNT